MKGQQMKPIMTPEEFRAYFKDLPSGTEMVIMCLPLLLLLLLPFVKQIPRHERRVYLNVWTGRYIVKNSLYTIVLPHLRPVPNRVFQSFKEFPAPSARPFTLDPPRVELRTFDGVPASIDVHVELNVIDWTGEDIEKAGGDTFEKRASAVVNSWLTQRISGMKSADLRDYALVQKVLNEKAVLEDLDRELKPFLFRTKRIFIDLGGISFSQEYLQTIAATIKLEGHASLHEMEAKQAVKEAEMQANVTRIGSEAANRARETRAVTAAKTFCILKESGLSPEQAVRLLMMDRLAEALERRSGENGPTAASSVLISPSFAAGGDVVQL